MSWIANRDDERLTELWDGHADLSDAALVMVLDAARTQCQEFAPALANPDEPPAHYVVAQVLQARALTRAGFVGSNDQVGGFGETVTVYPMDWQVKALLRPKKAPVVL